KVLGGESVVSPEMTTKLVSALRAHPPAAKADAPAGIDLPGGSRPVEAPPSPVSNELSQLSTREREILTLIAKGDSNKGIARQLDIAETTVKIHVQHILRKLNLTSRVQAAVFAARCMPP